MAERTRPSLGDHLVVFELQEQLADLGGHSLAALGMIGELKAQCGVQLPVSMLLGNASIAEIGVALEAEVVPALGPGQLDALLDQVAAGGGST